jgi:hypothetical protein
MEKYFTNPNKLSLSILSFIHQECILLFICNFGGNLHRPYIYEKTKKF